MLQGWDRRKCAVASANCRCSGSLRIEVKTHISQSAAIHLLRQPLVEECPPADEHRCSQSACCVVMCLHQTARQQQHVRHTMQTGTSNTISEPGREAGSQFAVIIDLQLLLAARSRVCDVELHHGHRNVKTFATAADRVTQRTFTWAQVPRTLFRSPKCKPEAASTFMLGDRRPYPAA